MGQRTQTSGQSYRQTGFEGLSCIQTCAKIETAIDAWKNVLEADRTYMQNSFSLEGWMFVNHMVLQWYYHILNMLKKHKLNAKISVNDFIKMLMEIKTVKMKDKWLSCRNN